MQNKIYILALTIALLGTSIGAQVKEPKTVRDFFRLLPQKYFPLEGCRPERDQNCDKARADYIKTFLEIEDTPNGYWKSGCDGAQTCLEMALFKRPNGSYIVGLRTYAEVTNDSRFLEYRKGVWFDVSTKIVPQFSRKKLYELPRHGTTVEVFSKKIIEKGKDYEVSEKGAKLYDMIWSNGKFSIFIH